MQTKKNTGLERRISLSCAHLGITEASLAERIGVSRAYLSAVKLGKSKGLDALEKSARILKVDPQWLAYGKGTPPEWELTGPEASLIINNDTVFRIKVREYPTVALGAIPGSTEDDLPKIEFPSHGEAVIFSGTGGLPLVRPGQAVLVDPRLPPKRDDIVLTWINNEPVLNRFVEDRNGQIFLASINAGVDSIVLDADELALPPLVVIATLLATYEIANK